MAYRIIYESEKEQKQGNRGGRRILLTIVFFVCFLWSVVQFWPEGKEILQILLIPGDPEVTLEAAEVFAQELGCGYSLKDAVRNFCITVLSDGFPG